MKRKLTCLMLILALLLSGCGGDPRPAHWQEDWNVISPFLAAEPMEDFDFGESDDILGIGGVYYAAWTNGDPRPFTNAEGEQTSIFNSQIYVVAQECPTEAGAAQELNAWIAREKQNYTVLEEITLTAGGRDYTLLTLEAGREGNPYGFGCAAFTVSGANAICVELVCSDTFTAEPRLVLEEFLGGLHFSE